MTHIELERGEVWVRARPTDLRSLVVEHGGWSAWVHGTDFRVRALGARVELRVREGDVLLRGPGAGSGVHVVAGELARVSEQGALTVGAEEVFLGAQRVSAESARVGSVARRRGAGGVDEALLRRASIELAGGEAPRALVGFETYLRRHPRGELAEDAMAGVMDARRSLGDTPGAQRAARRYLESFPEGVARGRAQALLASGAGGL